MAVTITYNSDIKTLFQTFYSNHQVDFTESLAWLINDEKSIGTSEEQITLINLMANFYFEIIKTIRQSYNASWEYTDWLTEDEYNAIMYKREILGY